MRRAFYVALSAVGGLLLILAVLFGALQTGFVRDRLGLLIADMTAGSSAEVHVDTIEGLVPFDMRLVGIRLSDRDGVWATADRVDVAWSPEALLAGRLQIDRLAAGTVDLARTPVATETQEPEPSGPLIPDLPVSIDLRHLSVDRLALAAPILGEPAALSLQGHARVGEIADGLSASLALRQLAGNTGTAAIDLAYRPGDDFLSVTGRVDEPQGGVVGRLLGLPPRSDLRIVLDGEGPLQNWSGRLNADLEGERLVDLTAEIRGDAGRTITFALQAAPDPLLPQQVQPLVAGGIRASGTFEITPERDAIGVSAFSATTAAGEVDATGVLGLDKPGDLEVTIALAESDVFATLVPDVAWSGATLRARLQGVIDRPTVTGNAHIENFRAADLRVGSADLAVGASAEDGLEQPIGVRGDLELSDVETAEPVLTALLAGGARMRLSGSVDRAGTMVADSLEIHAAPLALSGTGRAEQWGATEREIEATLTIADLAPIMEPLGFSGTGAVGAMVMLEPTAAGERLVVDGTAQELSTGQPIADRLLGQSPSLHLALTGNIPEQMTITTARVIGANARLDAQGSIASQALDISFTLGLEDLVALDPTLGGRVMLDGAIYGTMDAPTLVAELNAPAITVDDQRFEQVNLGATATDLLSNPQVQLEGGASFEGLPMRLTADLATEGERVAAPNLVLTIGQSRLSGDIAVMGGLLTGTAQLEAPDLGELGQLAGLAMGGELSASFQLDHSNGRQSVRLSATGGGISATDALTATGLELTATVDDLFGTPLLTADLRLSQPTIADRQLSEALVAVEGPLSALEASVSLTGENLTAAADAEITQITEGYRIALRRLTADILGVNVNSERPASIEIGAGTTRIDDLFLAVEDGSVRLNGTVAPEEMALSATIDSVPVSIARAFAPDLPMTGRLDGEIQLEGTPAAPSGRFTVTGTDIGATNVPEQQADLEVTGTLQQGRLNINGEVRPKGGGELTFTATLPRLAADARLQANAQGTFDLLLVDAFLAGGADRVRGKAELDISATGTLKAPEISGQLRLVNAAYDNLRYGIKLRRIEADVRADGPLIRVASLSATTPGGGQISGEGQVNLADGTELALRIQARDAVVMDTDLATATVNAELALIGDLQSLLELSGTVTVLRADIRVPDNLPPSVQEIEVVEVNAPPELAERIAEREAPPRQTIDVALDLTVHAPQQVTVRGRGLDVELGGTLHIGGTAARPEIEGALNLRRGTLDIAGKRLDFTEGSLTFLGGEDIDPILDLTAVTRAQDLEVTAKVEGPARTPRISLSSVPTLPDDEILARLLFSKSAGALSAFELLQLAQATADLAGISGGPGVLETLRRRTGLDRLSLEQAEGAAGPSLSAGRYVTDRVYVGVSQGAASGSSAATVEIELTPNIKLESEVGAEAGSKAGINLEWDY